MRFGVAQNGAWRLLPQKVWMPPITTKSYHGSHAQVVLWTPDQLSVTDPKFLETAEKKSLTFWAHTGQLVKVSNGEKLRPETFVIRAFRATPKTGDWFPM